MKISEPAFIGKSPKRGVPKKRILFVDDEFFLRKIICEVLTKIDYEVKVEASGEKAVRTFIERPEAFDLVLTDLIMPDMRGDELAEIIRSVRPNVPVVVITGMPDSLPRARAEASGICKVLPKPLTIRELHEGLQGAIYPTMPV